MIKNRVLKVLAGAASCKPEELKDETVLSTAFGLDSLDHLELLLSLEEEFEAELHGKNIPDELFENHALLTVGKMVELTEMFLETLN